MVSAVFQTCLKLQSRLSGVSNEARFVFTVQSIVMSQKLKGTLTFIVKVHTYIRTHTHHFYLMTSALCPLIKYFQTKKTNRISFNILVFPEWGLLHSWETGLQTALYLHLVPNHYSLLQVGVLVFLEVSESTIPCGLMISDAVKAVLAWGHWSWRSVTLMQLCAFLSLQWCFCKAARVWRPEEQFYQTGGSRYALPPCPGQDLLPPSFLWYTPEP